MEFRGTNQSKATPRVHETISQAEEKAEIEAKAETEADTEAGAKTKTETA